MMKKKIGEVTNYFANIGVAAIQLSDVLKVGQTIKIEGATTDYEQEVKSLELNRQSIDEGKAGQEIAIKVKNRVREGDEVFVV